MFAQRLRELRRERGLTQIQLAQKFNVSNGTIGMWETGKREPDFDTTRRLAAFFHVSVDYLVGNVNDPFFHLDMDRTLREINSYEDEETAPAPEGGRRAGKAELMAAFWGGDQDISPEDMDAMWTDVENFAAFIAQQKKREKRG